MLSRVAECLLWMSRYIERAENNARLLEVNLQLMLDFESQSEATVRQHWAPIINSLEGDLAHLDATTTGRDGSPGCWHRDQLVMRLTNAIIMHHRLLDTW